MKRLLYIFGLLLASVLAQGCLGWYNKMSHFSDEDLKWCHAFDSDTVIFRSNLGTTDTLVVEHRELDNSRNPFFIHYIDNMPDETHFASFHMRFRILNEDKVKIRGSIDIRKKINDEKIYFFTFLGNLCARNWDNLIYDYTFKNIPSDSITNSSDITTFEINGREFKNSIVFDESNSERFESTYDASYSNLIMYVINKDYGLLYYEKSDGERFVRADIDIAPITWTQ